MATFFQIFFVILLLGAMVMVLLGIGELANGREFENYDETESLKAEIESQEDVVSDHNMFHKLVDNDLNKHRLSPRFKSLDEESENHKDG